jgi:hypothetical protein
MLGADFTGTMVTWSSVTSPGQGAGTGWGGLHTDSGGQVVSKLTSQ